jgi:hypothetical protein
MSSLPRSSALGEGESFAVHLRIRATGFAGRSGTVWACLGHLGGCWAEEWNPVGIRGSSAGKPPKAAKMAKTAVFLGDRAVLALSNGDYVLANGDCVLTNGDCVLTNGVCLNPNGVCLNPDGDCLNPDGVRLNSDDVPLNPDDVPLNPDDVPLHSDGVPLHSDGGDAIVVRHRCICLRSKTIPV